MSLSSNAVKAWNDLMAIENRADVRYCNQCEQPVYFYHNYEQLHEKVSQKKCVAFQLQKTARTNQPDPTALMRFVRRVYDDED